MKAQLLVALTPEKRLCLQGLTLAKEMLPAFPCWHLFWFIIWAGTSIRDRRQWLHRLPWEDTTRRLQELADKLTLPASIYLKQSEGRAHL